MFEIGTQQHQNCLLCAVCRSTRNITVEYMFQITHLITGLFSITDVQEYIHSTRMDKPGVWGQNNDLVLPGEHPHLGLYARTWYVDCKHT